MEIKRNFTKFIFALFIINYSNFLFADLSSPQLLVQNINDCSNPKIRNDFSKCLPQKKENNLWHSYAESNTAIVFVHGILGDSRDTWFYKDESNGALNQYWPALISGDKKFKDISIFLGGYETSVNSSIYDGNDAATELWNALNRDSFVLPDKISSVGKVMDKDNIIFVGHSTGGIMARYVLYHHREAFKDKTVGLVLIASPSYGSKWANTLGFIIDMYNNQLAKQLKFGSEFLKGLDGHFKDMKDDENQLPHLIGIEGVEHHFIVNPWWFPWWNREILVDRQSGGRYFKSPEPLRNTDHFSTVKPNNRSHPGYQLLSDFFSNKFRNKIIERTSYKFDELVSEARRIRGNYESLDDYPRKRNDVSKNVSLLLKELIEIPDNELLLIRRIKKYESVALCYFILADLETSYNKKRLSLALKAIESSNIALPLIKDARTLALQGSNKKQKKVYNWLANDSSLNRNLYYKASALAITARYKKIGESFALFWEAWNGIDTNYKDEWPPTSGTDLKWLIDVDDNNGNDNEI